MSVIEGLDPETIDAAKLAEVEEKAVTEAAVSVASSAPVTFGSF